MEELVHSSLFGRLGEEYIQLVDPMDETTLQKFLRLTMHSEASKIPETKAFLKSTMDTKAFQEEGRITWEFPVKNRFLPNEQHPWASERLAKMPKFRPRIMFRPCKNQCWLPPPRPRRGQGREGVVRYR